MGTKQDNLRDRVVAAAGATWRWVAGKRHHLKRVGGWAKRVADLLIKAVGAVGRSPRTKAAARWTADKTGALHGNARKRIARSNVKAVLASAVRSVREHYPFIDAVKDELVSAFALNDREAAKPRRTGRRTRGDRKKSTPTKKKTPTARSTAARKTTAKKATKKTSSRPTARKTARKKTGTPGSSSKKAA